LNHQCSCFFFFREKGEKGDLLSQRGKRGGEIPVGNITTPHFSPVEGERGGGELPQFEGRNFPLVKHLVRGKPFSGREKVFSSLGGK